MKSFNKLISVENLFVFNRDIPIVKDINFTLEKGDVLGVVGESGCGKSTMLRALMAYKNKDSRITGSVNLFGKEITMLSEEELRKLRGNEVSMISQNAFLSMDSTKTISSLFYETIKMHRLGVDRRKSDAEACVIMKKLLLDDPQRILKSYPFELSGGMCQRVSIALSTINKPELILGDEPTSALDLTTQLQVVNQLKVLRREFGVSLIIVSHNMGFVANMSDYIAIMYGGQIVEYGKTAQVLKNPLHPYTKVLIEAIPNMEGEISAGLAGTPPVFEKKMKGCSFAERCPEVMAECRYKEPKDVYVDGTHRIRCLRLNE